jgi:hypothetical protein
MAEQCRPQGPIIVGLTSLAIAAQPFFGLFVVCFNQTIGPCFPHVRQTHMPIMAASMTTMKSDRGSWWFKFKFKLSTNWLAGLYLDL